MDLVMHAAVVEDSTEYREHLVSLLDEVGREHGLQIVARCFDDGVDLVQAFQSQFDLVFLDIDMPGLSGIETARRVRAADAIVQIVFVTNLAQHAIKGYEVGAIDYLVKPVPRAALDQTVARAGRRLRSSTREALTLSLPGTTVRVDTATVSHLESRRHRVVVNTFDRAYTVDATLKAFEERLAEHGFFRCHHGYVVNMRHVVEVSGSTCVLAGGQQVQISRPRRRAFLEALTDHLGRS